MLDKPSLEELCEQSIEEIAGRLEVDQPVPKKSVVGVLGMVFGGLVYGNYLYLDSIKDAMSPLTATGEWLDKWAESLGIKRKPAAFTEIVVKFDGSIPVDTDLLCNDEKYAVIEEINPVGVVAIADARGIRSVKLGDVVSLQNSIIGVSTEGSVAEVRLGTDAESDDDLRHRVLLEISERPAAGSPADFRRWALATPGITRAICFRATRPLVVLVADRHPGKTPSAAMVTATRDYIATQTLICCDVIGVTEKKVGISIRGPISEARKSIITEQIRNLIDSIDPGGTLFLSDISAPVLNAEKSIPCGQTEILTLGDLSWGQ